MRKVGMAGAGALTALALAALGAMAGVEFVDAQTSQFRNTQTFGHGQGTPELVTLADPAAGAEVTHTVPAREYWRVVSVRVTLVTNATVANRRISLVLDDGTTEYYRAGGSTDITASSSAPVVFSLGFGGAVANAGVHMLPLPEWHILPPGHRLRTATTAIQAGDNYGVPVAMIEKYRF